MPTTVWKAFISFGLVCLPVRLFAARYSRVERHEVHRAIGTSRWLRSAKGEISRRAGPDLDRLPIA
jgi:non-homologous end joining protein Ku